MTILRAGVKTGFASAKLTADENISNITGTNIPWDVIIDDEYSMYAGGSPTRLTSPSWATLARYGSSINWSSNNAGYRHVWQHKNGAQPNGRGSDQLNVSTGSIEHTHTCWSAPLVIVGGTDYFETRVYQNSGGTRQVRNTSASWHSLIILGSV
jgi:hypothetical protein